MSDRAAKPGPALRTCPHHEVARRERGAAAAGKRVTSGKPGQQIGRLVVHAFARTVHRGSCQREGLGIAVLVEEMVPLGFEADMIDAVGDRGGVVDLLQLIS